MSGKVQVARIEQRLFTTGMTDHPDLQIINHDFAGAAAQELQCMSVAAQDHTLAVFDCLTYGLTQLSSSSTNMSDWVALDPTGILLAHWDTRVGKTLFYEMPTGTPKGVRASFVDAMSPGGRWVATSSPEGRGITLIRADDPKLSLTLGIDLASSGSPQFSPDGRRLAWGTIEGTVFVCAVEATIRRLTELGLGW